MASNAEMAAAWDGPEGDHWADNAGRYEATSERFRSALLGALDLRDDSGVVDIGCGTGAATREAARIAAKGAVLGVDLSRQMLEVARARAAADGLDHVRFERADAQVHPFDRAAFDVAISCFGAMFFADPVAALANIRRSLRPGASLALLAWRDLARNEWVDAVRTALAAGRSLPVPPPGSPGPFSMADRHITTSWLTEAGYRDLDLSSVDEPLWFGRDADDAYSFVSTFGVTRGLIADLDDAARTDALDQLHQTLKDHETPDGVTLAGSAWLITANNPEEAR